MNDHINEHYYGDPTDPQTLRCRARIHWICRQAQGAQVLDLGCSQGITCLALAREGFDCTGVDNDQVALDYFQNERAKESEPVRNRVRMRLADATGLPFGDGTFDTVILGEILEHLSHPERVLEEARRVLRENARVIVTVPHGLNAFPDHKRSYYPLSLLRATLPYFQTEVITTLEGYIAYCGRKLKAYTAAQVSTEEMLGWYEKLDRKLEERCLAKEQMLLEITNKLYAQIKTQSQEILRLGETIKQHKDALAAREEELKTLQAARQAERQKEINGELQKLRADLGAQLTAMKQSIEDLPAELSRKRSMPTAEFGAGPGRPQPDRRDNVEGQ